MLNAYMSEGDVSMTRQDAAIGDNRNFQVDLYDTVRCHYSSSSILFIAIVKLLLNVGAFGDDSPITGNKSIVTIKVMQEFKFSRFLIDQKANPKVRNPCIPIAHILTCFSLNITMRG
jgi:hypothetical protein